MEVLVLCPQFRGFVNRGSIESLYVNMYKNIFPIIKNQLSIPIMTHIHKYKHKHLYKYNMHIHTYH